MKKTILLSSLFAVGAAFAETAVDSGNAVGALDLSVSNNVPSQQQTLISVPFVGYETGGAVKVKDMVKTGNLADGSKLYVTDGNRGYHTWKLDEGAWVADTKVAIGANGQPAVSETGSQDAVTVKRGDSFWLEPKFTSPTTEGTIYLLGQKGDGAGESTAAEKWNLLGNASVSPVTLSNESTSGFTDGEQVVVQVDGKLRYYTYKSGKGGWRYTTSAGKWSNPETDKLTIAAGQGFWYRATGSKTIDWSTGAIKAAVVTP